MPHFFLHACCKLTTQSRQCIVLWKIYNDRLCHSTNGEFKNVALTQWLNKCTNNTVLRIFMPNHLENRPQFYFIVLCIIVTTRSPYYHCYSGVEHVCFVYNIFLQTDSVLVFAVHRRDDSTRGLVNKISC